MLTAIMSDIHANREAFSACLDHARARKADRLILLGDYVGYGADPEWVVDRVMNLVAEGAVALKGNHDDAIENRTPDMNGVALAAIEWTRPRLDEERRRFLGALPMRHEEDGRLHVHANAWAPGDWDYVRNERDAERSLRNAAARVTFVGHVHVAALYALCPDGAARLFRPQRGVAIPLLRSRRWLCVAAAVGQPRDGVTAAGYCLFDSARNDLRFERVPYDYETAARKVEAAGLPPVLARRLRGEA
jgi:diadenosine tetraphosphatase ApaH/serine/threonine PP2A family protein phosphatase